MKAGNKVMIVLFLFVIIFYAIIGMFVSDYQQPKPTETQLVQQKAEKILKAKQEKEEEEKCKKDLTCWSNMHDVYAYSACKPILEKLPNWDYKWTSWVNIFDSFMWTDKKTLIIRYIGHDLKIQNGFGNDKSLI